MVLRKGSTVELLENFVKGSVGMEAGERSGEKVTFEAKERGFCFSLGVKRKLTSISWFERDLSKLGCLVNYKSSTKRKRATRVAVRIQHSLLTRNQGLIDVRSTGKEFRSRKIFEMVLEVRSLIAGILVFQDSGGERVDFWVELGAIRGLWDDL
ncbi:hypothetical protein CK203_042782 [Vitis vinifera]|uniref:Uncharacterized protein n=1 Tax=Vitis vinifera TaxID=29760 RepID=A0A438HQP4_VITVI|nr:hypothetical protein CK203_042782 [Vitis vinifera]